MGIRDLLHRSLNAPVPFPTMHLVHFCVKCLMHCGICEMGLSLGCIVHNLGTDSISQKMSCRKISQSLEGRYLGSCVAETPDKFQSNWKNSNHRFCAFETYNKAFYALLKRPPGYQWWAVLYQASCVYAGLILGLRPANKRRRYFVTTSLIAWAQA